MASKEQKKHIVAFAMPFQGHINPLFNFVCNVALQTHNLAITFVNTEAGHADLLKANGGEDPILRAREDLGVDLRSRQVSDGLPIDYDRHVNRDILWDSMTNSMISHVRHLMSSLTSSATPPVSCLLADNFYVWPAQIAKEFGLPLASFYTESVAVYSIFAHWDVLVRNGHLPFPETADIGKKLIDYIPGLPALKITDLPSFLQERDVTTVLHRMFYKSFQSTKKAKWILSNTVDELETSVVCALKALGSPFLSIGPILPPDFLGKHSAKLNLGRSLGTETDCSAWLDSKPKNSVVYISFGSFARCSVELLREFALGLMNSKQYFIWVLRGDAVDADCTLIEEVLPKEFREGTKLQGMVVQWCRQTEVLAHSSVGAFLSHCGWNSVMEGLWAGVPMLTFPLHFDQFTNCWIVTELLQIAKGIGNVSSRSHNHIRAAVSRDEVARSITEFMADGAEREKVRSRSAWAMATVRNAILVVGGTSFKNLKSFLDAL